MCGISAYIGYREAYPIVINGLKRLEYRGYDSAGVMIYDGKKMQLSKTKGKVSDLEAIINSNPEKKVGKIGMGHTRWATHGIPNDVNSHPHPSQSGNLVLVHNGIIENYDTIKKELVCRGYTFKSDTDTEVLVNLIEEVKKNEDCKLGKAVQLALTNVVGAYAIAVFDKDKPNELIVARLGSPIAIGVGEENSEFFVASDASPFLEYTKNAIYLEDEEMAIIRLGRPAKVHKIFDDSRVDPMIQELQLSLEQIEKGGYDHFMLKEIHEQPNAINNTLEGRLSAESVLDETFGNGAAELFKKVKHVQIVACGTSYHSGMVARYWLESLGGISCNVEIASEFRYRKSFVQPNSLLVSISQSGETADTLAALELAKSKGATILGICNVVGSSIARITDAGSYTHAGPEIAVASTKALLTQIIAVYLIGLHLGQVNGSLKDSEVKALYKELLELPGKIEQILETVEPLRELTRTFAQNNTVLFLGRNIGYPVALEGALKLKELAYIHAEGFAGGELKHGPIALIDQGTPVIAILPAGHEHALDEKMLSNIQEVKARGARVIVIAEEGAHVEGAEHIIRIPVVPALFQPVLATVPLQVFAYEMAVARGNDVDQPRNLAKSVTVE